jgi:hypothetical protein
MMKGWEKETEKVDERSQVEQVAETCRETGAAGSSPWLPDFSL